MSSKTSERAMQRKARPTCQHAGAVWQQAWAHEGMTDRRRGGCPTCGQQVEQRAACPAYLMVGQCRDQRMPTTAAPVRLRQVAPAGWAMVPAVPWWAQGLLVATRAWSWCAMLARKVWRKVWRKR